MEQLHPTRSVAPKLSHPPVTMFAMDLPATHDEPTDPSRPAPGRRRFDIDAPRSGITHFGGVLSLEDALVVRAALDHWMQLRQPEGTPHLADPRSAAQLRHDALIGICTHFLARVTKQ